MSATVSTPVLKNVIVSPTLSPKEGGGKGEPLVPSKKVRVPTTLPAKYGKFIQFGYFMMNKLNACDGDEDTPPLIDEQVFLNKMRIFEPLEDQQAFVEEFLESSKQINDELRKMMLQRKRDIAKASKAADKPPKEKKPRQIKEKKSEESAAVPVEKKSKAKKVKVTSTEDALVNELVQLAEGSASEEPKVSSLSKKESAEGTNGLASLIPLPPPSKKESAKAAVAKLIAEVPKIADPVKETKPKVVKETKPKEEKPKSGEPTSSFANPPETPSLPVKETKPKVAKEEKSKVVKETKPKAAKETTPVAEEITNDKEGVSGGVAELDIGSPEEEELQVSIFMYEGQQYLIDDLNNVYDFTSQDKIGSLVDQILVKST